MQVSFILELLGPPDERSYVVMLSSEKKGVN